MTTRLLLTFAFSVTLLCVPARASVQACDIRPASLLVPPITVVSLSAQPAQPIQPQETTLPVPPMTSLFPSSVHKPAS